MKTLFILFAVLFTFSTANAQSNVEDIEMIQALYGKDKKMLIDSFLQLQGTQATEFWKLYDEYEVARKKLCRQRFALLERFANQYETADDKQIDQLMKDIFSLQRDNDKLIEQYYNKIKTKAGYKAAARFTQVEAYLLSVIRASLLEKIPYFSNLYN